VEKIGKGDQEGEKVGNLVKGDQEVLKGVKDRKRGPWRRDRRERLERGMRIVRRVRK